MGKPISGQDTKNFKAVVISFVIATPIAGWAMTKWLQGFVYRIPVSWWMFAIWINSRVDCAVYGKFAGHKSCIDEPGEEFKNRIGRSY